MANFYGTSRSNFVFVKDVALAKRDLAPFNLNVHTHEVYPNAIMVSGDDEGGMLETSSYDLETDEDITLEWGEWAAKHLVEGQTLILISAGAEKLRYISAWAAAYTWDGRAVAVDLYQTLLDRLSADLGIGPVQVADPYYTEVLIPGAARDEGGHPRRLES